MNKNIIIGAVVVVLLLIGGAYFYLQDGQEVDDAMMEDDEMMMEKDDAVMQEEDAMMEKTSSYQGTVLAGTTAPLLDFTKADYDAAVASDKLVVLYFYANWCPICRAEFPKMEDAFNQLTSENVIGFRVNFNDNETDDFEKDLARQYGVAYQHTKVLVKNGEQVLKSPESWEQARYLEEINSAL